MVRPRNETEELLLSITKIVKRLLNKRVQKRQETLRFKLTQPKETFSLKPSIILGFDSNWKLCLTRFEVCNSIFHIT